MDVVNDLIHLKSRSGSKVCSNVLRKSRGIIDVKNTVATQARDKQAFEVKDLCD